MSEAVPVVSPPLKNNTTFVFPFPAAALKSNSYSFHAPLTSTRILKNENLRRLRKRLLLDLLIS